MECAEYIEWIARRLEGTLTERETRKLDGHLSECSRCRAEAVLQARILETLKKETPSGLSADFTVRVSERVRAVPRAGRFDLRWPALVPSFAAVVAAVLLFVFRNDVAAVGEPVTEALAVAIGTPLAWFGDLLTGLFSGLQAASGQGSEGVMWSYSYLANSLSVVVAAGVAVIWAFSRVRAYLRG